MLISKITTGFVIQTFDSDKRQFIQQHFVASDDVAYEDEQGKPVDPTLLTVDGREQYLPFEMRQPGEQIEAAPLLTGDH